MRTVEAAIFDLDDLLIDSEQAWDDVRREFVAEEGGHWQDRAQRDMMGMSSTEWSRYVRDELGVDMPPERISAEVVARITARYQRQLPLLPGAREAVGRLARHLPLGLASSSNRELIDLVLDVGGLADSFAATVSSEEVARGKPAPDVYLEAARRLGVPAPGCVAIEDSHNGIRSAVAAGMRVIAIPNRAFPPGAEALAAASLVLGSLSDLTAESVSRLDSPDRDA
jgi:HAD superfamily hydrolase (TIGR01509 family)